MDKKTFFIPNISCGHCTAAIRNELLEMDGVASVDGSPGDRTVTVEWAAPATEAAIVARLEEMNYPPSA